MISFQRFTLKIVMSMLRVKEQQLNLNSCQPSSAQQAVMHSLVYSTPIVKGLRETRARSRLTNYVEKSFKQSNEESLLARVRSELSTKASMTAPQLSHRTRAPMEAMKSRCLLRWP